jgi:hypothetical protein
MDPNAWKKLVPNLRADLAEIVGDVGAVDSLLSRAVQEFPRRGRASIWRDILAPRLADAWRRHPSRWRRSRELYWRIESIVMTGEAAEVPDRLRAVLNDRGVPLPQTTEAPRKIRVVDVVPTEPHRKRERP